MPGKGAAGVGGWEFITTFAEAAEVHPVKLVTVKLYVPGVRFCKVKLEPVPVDVILPGSLVKVHAPAGKPVKTTLPVAVVHVGCTIVPGVGAAGMGGC
jgi:hypothetical protein